MRATDAAPQPGRSGKGGRGNPGAGNQPPVAVDDARTVREDKLELVDVLANDSDPDGLDRKSLTVVKGPNHGEAKLTGEGGFILYEAKDDDDDFSGDDWFQYQICDTKGACSVATVRVTILSD